MHVHRVLNVEESLSKQVEDWWQTESFGTKYEDATPRSREDKRALETLERIVKHVSDGYEARMLWNEQDVKFPDNRLMAEKRLDSTGRKLKRDEKFAKKYCAIIDDYVVKGYARKLTPDEASVPTPKQWFLPHHPVRNPNKPDKVRIVIDAAAMHDGVSLNDKLRIGPDLLNSLVGVLLRIREQRVGLAADIEAMFHQVRIIEEDQPALRFLWRNLEVQRPPDVYQMLVMIFGAASSPCTGNYVLRRTALDNYGVTAFFTGTIEAVEKNFYMDDFLKSVCDEATAVRMFYEMTSLLARGGFRLTKWIRLRARPEPPVMANLPDSRLGYMQPPFTNTGVDYFGPMLVRDGIKTEKRYGLLFTCLTTRAVHLDIAHSLNTDSCLMAIRRMIARRGKPAHIWSDNGTNFVGSENELREAIKRLGSERIGDQLSDNEVQWHFNPPSSPHFGGDKTCSQIKLCSLSRGSYVIDPDGNGGVKPFKVYCDMTDKNGVGVTVVSHDSESRTLVKGYSDPGAYSRNITYTEADMA
ncbi:hypothetical protein AWC38_SpisGene22184 [Stylophora pistillata]|uniref:Fibrinogen C-terminal domain-containing protein n=1 Tax=Stylophora pistillata TaxID=50429 RepID=A0A2B4RBV8_STYPI|nr:hypothetical protein AWC38_SpisGene22184 [Stylophora pistillata]